MDLQQLQEALSDLDIADIHYFESIGSTHDHALDWCTQGALEYSLVVADEQTTGRGRMQRQWITRKGAALAFSLIFKPTPEEMQRVALFSALGAISVCLTLEKMLGETVAIKWPNDVLLAGKKVCGVLSEAIWQDDCPKYVVMGIGINVASSSVPSASELLFPAISIEDAYGYQVKRIDLLRDTLEKVIELRKIMLTDAFLSLWETRLAFRGKAVQIERIGRDPITGILDGLNMDGSLRIISYTGIQEDITAAEIRLRPV